MRRSSLNVEDIERILDSTMEVASNRCAIEPDGTLTVQLHGRDETLTVVGIKADEFHNAEAVQRLALSLLDELQITSSSGGPVLTTVEARRKAI